MTLIRASDWEAGRAQLTDEWFVPVYWPTQHHPFRRIIAYRGQRTGIRLGPVFGDILEQRIAR